MARANRSLDGLFRPRSVAVVGASRRAATIGHEVVANLVDAGFTGPVYPVNPRAKVVRSMRSYASLAKIPDPVDLAVIVVPAEHVAAVARACGRKGVKGLVVVSAGFRETGDAGAQREEELLRIASRHGMRVIGPNCMGVINTEPAVQLNASFAAARPVAGEIGFVSQSGALGEAILADARDAGLGIRMFASVGNRADVGAHDLLEYWEHDAGIELILLYLESFGDPQRFKAVAERLRGIKPIVAVKSGRSEAGARAAGSHTGSIAGTDVTIDTFLAQCGVLRAATMRQMFQVAGALLHQPRPRGAGIAVVTNAGGPGILATDALSRIGLEPVALTDATESRLVRVLPAEASTRNPVDLIASADADRYRAALSAIVRDAHVDALVVLFVSPIMIDAEAVARAIVETTQRAKKPVVACLMGRQHHDEAHELLQAAGISVFRFPEEAARTLGGLVRYWDLAGYASGARPRLRVDRKRAERVLRRSRPDGGGWLPASDARELVAAYGIPMIATRVVPDATAARKAAIEIGHPVCLKATAAGLVHKSDLGGVLTQLADDEAVGAAARRILRRLGRRYPDLALEVQPMAPGHRELLIGMKRDERFGPVLAVGLGGITVEVLRDVALRIGPLHQNDPAEMLASLRGAPLLDAFRGEPAVDRNALADCVLRLDRLAADFPAITEIDLNPVIAAAPGKPSYVVDARVCVTTEG